MTYLIALFQILFPILGGHHTTGSTAITLLDHKTAQNTASCPGANAPGLCTSPALNCGTSSGTAYFLAISYFDTGDPTSVTSSDGHSFTTAPPSGWINSTDASRIRQYYILNITGSTSVTFSATGYYQSMYAACFLAPAGKTWSLDKDVGANNTGDNTTTIQGTTSGVLAAGGELMLMSVFWDSRGSGSTPPAGVPGSINSSFTVLDANDILVSPLSVGGGLGYKIKSAGDTTAENPIWTMSVGGRTATGLVSYKAQ